MNSKCFLVFFLVVNLAILSNSQPVKQRYCGISLINKIDSICRGRALIKVAGNLYLWYIGENDSILDRKDCCQRACHDSDIAEMCPTTPDPDKKIVWIE